ncbi:MAG: hypothetical protein U0840_07230 [Gemmataceae bacterium]
MSSAEPRNPLYLLLLVAGLVFSVTALAYALVPVLEQRALDSGATLPPSALRDALRADGWKWLLIEVGVLIVLGVASMAWDVRRSLNDRSPLPTMADRDARSPDRLDLPSLSEGIVLPQPLRKQEP